MVDKILQEHKELKSKDNSLLTEAHEKTVKITADFECLKSEHQSLKNSHKLLNDESEKIKKQFTFMLDKF